MTKLYVGSLPYSITDESVLQLFAGKGCTRGIRKWGLVDRLALHDHWLLRMHPL